MSDQFQRPFDAAYDALIPHLRHAQIRAEIAGQVVEALSEGLRGDEAVNAVFRKQLGLWYSAEDASEAISAAVDAAQAVQR